MFQQSTRVQNRRAGLHTILRAIVFFGLTAIGLGSSLVRAATWYCAPGGVDAAGHGTTLGTPFQSLYYAMVGNNSIANGDTIQLASGNYNTTSNQLQQCQVYRNGLTIVGAGTTQTTICCLIYGNMPVSSGWSITIKNLSIQGVNTIVGANAYNCGISLYGFSNSVVQNVNTRDTYSSGIALWGASEQYAGDPGAYYSGNPNWVTNDLIDSCVVDSACWQGGANEAIDMGDAIANSTISHCTVKDSDGAAGGYSHGGEGIDAKDAAYNITIRNNSVIGLYNTGIYIDGGIWGNSLNARGDSYIYVYDNEIKNCPTNCLTMDSEGTGPLNYVYVFNNVIHDNPLGVNRNALILQQYSSGSFTSSAPHTNIYIVNNTLANNGNNGLSNDQGSLWAVDPSASNVCIANNISANAAGLSIQIITGTNWYVLNNLTTNGLDGNAGGMWVNTGINNTYGGGIYCNSTQPFPFVTPLGSSDNFQLTSSATSALGAGANPNTGVAAWWFDCNGVPRPGSGNDLGAYQYTLPSGTYKMCPASATLQSLNVPASNYANGTTLILWSYVAGSNNEIWNVVSNGDGTYQIQTALNVNQVLNNYGGNAPGAAGLWTYSGTAYNEKFYITPTTGGCFTIAPATNTSDVLTTNGTANSSTVTFSAYSGSTSQQWIFGTP